MADCETDPLSVLVQVLQDVGFPIDYYTVPRISQPFWFSTAAAGNTGLKAGGGGGHYLHLKREAGRSSSFQALPTFAVED